MFSFLKKTISDGYKGLKNFFGIKNIDSIKETKEIENILLQNNFGPNMTKKLIANIEEVDENKALKIRENLKDILSSAKDFKEENKEILLIIGINGSGKTTSLIKLARIFEKNDKKTLVIPADTFRAAAQEQLKFLCENEKIDFFEDKATTEPATLIYKGITSFPEKYEKIIIDTAGRIHQNESLLRELKKIHKIASERANQLNWKVKTLIVLDSLQGQSLEKQIKEFSEIIPIDGIILTKLDSGAKPGSIISIIDTYKIPVAYLAYGEYKTEIVPFEIDSFVNTLIGVSNATDQN